MKRFTILAALFVSTLFLVGYITGDDKTYEEILRQRCKEPISLLDYDNVLDSLLYKADSNALTDFEHKILWLIVYTQPYNEDNDTVYVYQNYTYNGSTIDTVSGVIAKVNDEFPESHKLLKKLEKTTKTYVDTSTVVMAVTISWYSSYFKRDTYFKYYATVKGNEINLYSEEQDKPFFRVEKTYREIR